MYTEAQKKLIMEELEDFNHYFGYTTAPEGTESYSEFYDYPEASEDQKARYNLFE